MTTPDHPQPEPVHKSLAGSFLKLLFPVWSWIWNFARKHVTVAVILIVALVVGGWYALHQIGKTASRYAPSLSISFNDKIDVTPEEIRSIEQIGEWEFLSAASEELVDTLRKRFLSDDRLSRIYYGTLRLGIDTKDFVPDWFTARHDTAILKLPNVKLLDNHFINDAQTRAFYQSGSWSPRTKEDLYRRAQYRMKRRILTPGNWHTALQNRDRQFTNMFRAFGFNTILISTERIQREP